MLRIPFVLAVILAISPIASHANEKPVPDGLACPAEAGGAELLTTAVASTEPGVAGFCVYYAYDAEDPDRTVTLTLRIGGAGYDPDTSFKAAKVERGGMSVVEERTESIAFGGLAAPATVIALTGKEEGLGAITDVYNNLYVFRREGGRIVSLEEEYTNVSADLRDGPREAILGAQK